MIGDKKNQDDVFLRDLTVATLATLENQLHWVNRFSSGDVNVNVPIYYSMTGDERFLLDSFVDDIVSGDSCGNGRYIELNTDIIPRGHLTFKSSVVRSDEFANPNVWMKRYDEEKYETKTYFSRVRAIPITVNYDLTILLNSEIDTFKCQQAFYNMLWMYKFMHFEYKFMNIDAIITMPDDTPIEMTRDKSMDSDNSIKMVLSLEVQTYYPAYIDDNSEYEYNISPDRTKWYNNILKLRENTSRL